MDGSVDVGGLCQQARQQLKEGMNAEAVATARQATAVDPRSADAQHVLGLGLCQLGSLAEGVAALEASVGLMPTNVTYRVNLAAARERAGHWDAARMQWQEVLKLDPVNARAMGALHAIDQRLGPQPTVQMPQQPAAPPPPQIRYDLAGNPIPVQPPPGYQQPPPQPQYQQPGYQQQGYSQPGYQTPGYGTGAGYQAAGVYQPQAAAYGMGDDPGGWSLENVMATITNPREFFAANRGFTTLKEPVLFLIGLYVVWGAAALLVQLIKATIDGTMGSALLGLALAIPLGLVIGVPMWLLIQLVWAGIVHLLVMALGGRQGYGATLRAQAYTLVPVILAQMLSSLVTAFTPSSDLARILVFGGTVAFALAAGIWHLILITIALAELHSFDAWRGFVAAFLANVVMFVATLLLVLALAGIIVSLVPGLSGGSFQRPGYSRQYGNSPFGNPGMNSPSPFGGPGSGFGGPRYRTIPPPPSGPGGF